MNIMQQQQPTSPSSAIFQMVPCDSFDEMDEPTHEGISKSIFRQDQFDESNNVVRAPPLMRRANPIQSSIEDEEMTGYEEQTVGYITPYPLSPCQQELEERQLMSDDIGSLQGENDRDDGVNYSYYFSPLTVCDDIQDISFEEELVEGAVNQSVWDECFRQTSSTANVLQPRGRPSSPAQISVGSDFDDSRRTIGSI